MVTESPEVAAQSRGTVDKYHQIMEKSSVGARVCLVEEIRPEDHTQYQAAKRRDTI